MLHDVIHLFGTAKAVPFPILHDRKLCDVAARRQDAGTTIRRVFFSTL
jgi:hypothetical protein